MTFNEPPDAGGPEIIIEIFVRVRTRERQRQVYVNVYKFLLSEKKMIPS